METIAMLMGLVDGEGVFMPQTEPIAPPTKPREEPGPKREEPRPKPGRELDPFNPDWPKTRPTPEPKARGWV